MLNLPCLAKNWNYQKTDKQEKTVRPGVHKICPVSIYGEVYGEKDLRKRCVLSLEWKREGVIDGKNGGDDISSKHLWKHAKLTPGFCCVSVLTQPKLNPVLGNIFSTSLVYICFLFVYIN